MILNELSPKVNKILLEQPSNYRAKSVEEGDRGPFMTSPIQPIARIGRGPVTISKLNRDLSMPLKS
jgi:hypothetical protein